jgi:hydroxymethylpyrimidine pyrophosphatase-like HAD family hydrolase
VDGTLVTQENVLTSRARQALRRLRKARIAFAITSGCPPLGIDTPSAAFNGRLFVLPDLSIIDQRELLADVARRVVRTLEAHDLDGWMYRAPDWLVRQRHGPPAHSEADTCLSFASPSSGLARATGTEGVPAYEQMFEERFTRP